MYNGERDHEYTGRRTNVGLVLDSWLQTNTGNWTNAGLMLAHRLRRWTNI